MDLSNLVNIIVNNGVSVACVAYFMYLNNTTMKDFTTAMNNNSAILMEIKDKGFSVK